MILIWGEGCYARTRARERERERERERGFVFN